MTKHISWSWILVAGHALLFAYLYFVKGEWDYTQLVAAVAWMAMAKVEDLEKKVKALTRGGR